MQALEKRKAPAHLRLRITSAAERTLRSRHPWLFADSIREQNREGRLGELAVIYGRENRFLAVGLFDPISPIRVRVLQLGRQQAIDRDWFADRLKQAAARRSGLFDERTTGYRLVNGESDGLPGLVLDRYGATLVMKLYTAAWLPRLQELGELVKEGFCPEHIVLRLSRSIQEIAQSEFSHVDGQVLRGPALERPVKFLEIGLHFEADVLRGQKTGFFLDQRENRHRVETLARNRHVLNTFSFSGAFSLYAARGGAKSVTDLDLSAHALVAAKRNFALNQTDPSIAGCRHETIQGEAFEWLEKSRRKFELIVLDPPSFARRASERAGALRAYSKLARLGIESLARHGILVACSCSAHVTAAEFFDAILHSARRSRRKFHQLGTHGHPPDHPATFKEAEYLKAIFLAFDQFDR